MGTPRGEETVGDARAASPSPTDPPASQQSLLTFVEVRSACRCPRTSHGTQLDVQPAQADDVRSVRVVQKPHPAPGRSLREAAPLLTATNALVAQAKQRYELSAVGAEILALDAAMRGDRHRAQLLHAAHRASSSQQQHPLGLYPQARRPFDGPAPTLPRVCPPAQFSGSYMAHGPHPTTRCEG
jgi:hypothetical protein